jgi:hypothetical protein
MHKLTLSLVLLGGLAATAQAQESEHFRLEKTEHGYVRMDMKTGAMSLCSEKDAQLVCRPAADESAVPANDTSVQKRVEKLEKRVAELEGARVSAAEVPSEEEFDQGLDRMESFFRRFMGIVREFETEPKTQPDRT